MSTSKTARAAMKAGASSNSTAAVIPDDVLTRQYREERAAGIWPSLQKSDAVLRELDTIAKSSNERIAQLEADCSRLAIDAQTYATDLAEYKRQLVLANSIIETLRKAQADMMAVASAVGMPAQPPDITEL